MDATESRIIEQIDRHRDEIIAFARDIYTHAELGYKEFRTSQKAKEFLEKLTSFMDYALTQYANEGKNHFTVAIGCTGGQHRSVSITNWLYDHYSKKYRCYKQHREEKEWLRNEE